jgi:hypothetical protein
MDGSGCLRLEKHCPRPLVKVVVDILVMVGQWLIVKKVNVFDVCHVYGVMSVVLVHLLR